MGSNSLFTERRALVRSRMRFASHLVVLACFGLLVHCGESDDSGTGSTSHAGGTGGGDAGADAGAAGLGGGPGGSASGGTSGDAGDGGPSWKLPQCTSVTGTAAVTFSQDEGATLAPVAGALSGVVYTKGLVTLDTPNVLLAASGTKLLRSANAGCDWSEIGTLPSGTMILAKGIGDRAFAWNDNQDTLLRIDAETMTVLKSPSPNVIGLGTDPANADRLRLGGADLQLWESIDGGKTFQAVGLPALTSSTLLAYRVAFDPKNLDHALVGAANFGAWYTEDGGKSWTKSVGLSANGQANAFELAVSPVDSKVVWAEGIDLEENLGGAKNEGRHIWRSTDGGATFVKVVDHAAGDVTLTNGLPLVPHPTDANVVYFEFGTHFQGYGTDLFRYDAATKTLGRTHNAYDDMLAIAFSPADPSLLYLGITSEQTN